MIYRGPGRMIAPPPPVSKLSLFLCVAGRAYWRGRGEMGGGGAKSYDGEKAWSCINYSILSGLSHLMFHTMTQRDTKVTKFKFELSKRKLWRILCGEACLVFSTCSWEKSRHSGRRTACSTHSARPTDSLLVQSQVKYGVTSPKFIWAPCAHLYSLA